MRIKIINFGNKIFPVQILISFFLLLLSAKALSQPTITSFSPMTGPVGTTVTITGTNFSSVADSNIVYFGAVKGIVATASSTVLTVVVPPGASYHPITVTTSKLTVYSQKPFLVMFLATPLINPSPSSIVNATKEINASPNGPAIVLFADFNNDGKAEIISSTYNLQSSTTQASGICIYKNKSSPGNLQIDSPLNFNVNSYTYHFAVEDMDGDGKTDVLVPDYRGSDMRILKNTSTLDSISFASPLTVPCLGSDGVAVADFDADGKPDFATAHGPMFSTETGISVSRNTSSSGGLSFVEGIVYYLPSFVVNNVRAGFINDDNKPDLIAATYNSIVVFINTSTPANISFAPFVEYPLSRISYYGFTIYSALAIGDLDGDGKDDIVVGNNDGKDELTKIDVLRNTSTATVSFEPKKQYVTSDRYIGPSGLAIGDVDGNGKPDVIVSLMANKVINVLKNTSSPGEITFEPRINYLTKNLVPSIGVGDLDNDGKPDIVSGGFTPKHLFIYRNHLTNVSITQPSTQSTYEAGNGITVETLTAAPLANMFITKVEFYANGIKFGEDATAPFSYFVPAVEAGTYELIAVSTTNYGIKDSSSKVTISVLCTGNGSIFGEGYTNIPGSQIADLTGSAAYINNQPSVTTSLNNLEYYGSGDNYGVKLQGYICAPQTGLYTFYLSGDDQAGLWLSTNEDPANKKLIAYTEQYTNYRQWDKYASQKSVPVMLNMGTRYYIETLHKELVGPDHLSVAWTLPNGVFEGPIPGRNLLTSIPAFPDNLKSDNDRSFSTAMIKYQVTSNNKDFKVTVAPNPSSSYFTLHIQSSSSKIITVKVSDAAGRLVETKQTATNNGTIQVGNKLPAGIYIAEVLQDGKKQQMKLVKQ